MDHRERNADNSRDGSKRLTKAQASQVVDMRPSHLSDEDKDGYIRTTRPVG